MAGYPLGLRNNNPGNIRPFDPWKGMIGQNQGFAVFQDISWGIRAMGKAIIHEFNVGNNTVSKLIYEWAPPADGNNTELYISAVVSNTGYSRNQVLTVTRETLVKIIRAMMNVELGNSFSALITNDDINEGLNLIDSEIGPGTAATGFGISVLLFMAAVIYAVKMPSVKKLAR